MRWIAALPLLIAPLFVPAGGARSADSYVYAKAGSDWFVDLRAADRDVAATRGGTIFEVPIYPALLFQTAEVAADAETGKQLLAAGSQLIRHRLSSGEQVYCSTSDGGFMRNGIFTCLEDADKDGKLDSYYYVLSHFLSGSPIIDTGKSGIHKATRPLRIEEIDPRTLNNPAKLTIRWTGTASSTHFVASLSIASKKGKRLPISEVLRIPMNGAPNFALPHLTIAVASTKMPTVTFAVRRSRDFIAIKTLGDDLSIGGE